MAKARLPMPMDISICLATREKRHFWRLAPKAGRRRVVSNCRNCRRRAKTVPHAEEQGFGRIPSWPMAGYICAIKNCFIVTRCAEETPTPLHHAEIGETLGTIECPPERRSV